MQLNGKQVIDRHNRPNVMQAVALKAFFINDGVYQDPYDISSVTIFKEEENLPPSGILGSNGLLSSSLNSKSILMTFGCSATAVGDVETAYTGGADASGIYKINDGEYVVVLNGNQADLRGFYNHHGSGLVVTNSASATGNYIDAWTVKFASNSEYQTIINRFTLHRDKFFAVTEPLRFKAANKLLNKRITFGSQIDLKIATEVSLENKNIDSSVHNVFKDSIIASAMVEIKKVNENPSLPSRVTVSAFSDTSSVVNIAADNTILFNWQTERLKTHSKTSSGDMGSLTGPYTVQVKYTLLDQTIYSPLMHLIVT